MLNLSPYSDKKRNKPHSEKIGLEIANIQANPKLPRHISGLSSTKHRKIGKQEQASQMPTICSINLDADPAETINLAVNILKYQLNDRASKQKHVENVRRNLQHRLQAAQASENRELVSILQEEFRQLGTSV